MPVSHRIFSSPDIHYARYSGAIDAAAVAEGLHVCISDPRYAATRPELLDFAPVTSIDINYAQLNVLVSAAARELCRAGQTRLMCIYAPDPHVFALTRQFQALAEMIEGLEIRTFTSARDCLAALGIASPSIAELLATAVPLARDHRGAAAISAAS